MKKFFWYLLYVTIFVSNANCQLIKFGSARGLFMDVGVGPRFPIGVNSIIENIGVGVHLTFSYSDNELLPIFLYGGIGYQHHPGRQNFYRGSDYSAYSSNMVNFNLGARYYFSPLVEGVFLLMPIIEGGINWTYFFKLHEFKFDRYRDDIYEETDKFGFHIGAGFSMFLLDVVASYNYFFNNQYISLDLRVRIPIYVSL